MRLSATTLLIAALSASPALAGRAAPKHAPAPAPAPPEPNYVGLTVPPIPAGLTDEGGYLLPATNGTTYGIGLVKKGEQQMWWLQRLMGHSPDGKPRWSVEAVLNAPATEHHFVFGQCAVRGTPVPEIIAEAALEDAPTFTHVFRAWRVETAEPRFAPMQVTDVTCVNEGFGVEP